MHRHATAHRSSASQVNSQLGSTCYNSSCYPRPAGKKPMGLPTCAQSCSPGRAANGPCPPPPPSSGCVVGEAEGGQAAWFAGEAAACARSIVPGRRAASGGCRATAEGVEQPLSLLPAPTAALLYSLGGSPFCPKAVKQSPNLICLASSSVRRPAGFGGHVQWQGRQWSVVEEKQRLGHAVTRAWPGGTAFQNAEQKAEKSPAHCGPLLKATTPVHLC